MAGKVDVWQLSDKSVVVFGQHRRIVQSDGKVSWSHGYIRLREKSSVHFREHTRDALALFPGHVQIRQNPYDSGISAIMDLVQTKEFIQRQCADQRSRAHDFHTVVEKPYFSAMPFNAVIPVGNGVEQRFPPNEFGILRCFSEAVAD